MKKHMVYAEDVLQELMKHPDNAIYKWELRQIVNNVVREKEVTIIESSNTASCVKED
jgi:hypothetical protein